jgi:two-component system sensor histidine kinase DesK
VGLTVDCTLNDVVLSAMQESVFALILEEAATNVIRHAHAQCCCITVQATQDGVQLSVADDGQGSSRYDGFGLRGMRERLHLLGGSLHVWADHGTHLQASLPRASQQT